MAEKRKLLAEIDKVFRKVEEGVELFDDTMTKMQEANSENQREKFQDDLKKEIKKLQRLRDQIKTWQNSAEVKDKEKLLDFRKIVEGKMEQFKDVERENKTKPHSKQGLNAEEKLDPKEKEKSNTIEWLQTSIGRMDEQCDIFESSMEIISSSSMTKKKKGREDKEKARQSEDYKRKLERHKFHIQKLELIMRLVNNDSLEYDDVNNLRDEISDYVDRCQETDFVENEFIYDDLNLGDTAEITQQLGNVTNIGTLEDPEETSFIQPTESGNHSPSAQSKDCEGKEGAGKSRTGSEEKDSRPRSKSRSTPPTPLKLTSQLSLESALSTPPQDATPPPPQTFSYNSVAARSNSLVATKQLALSAPPSASIETEEKRTPDMKSVVSSVGWPEASPEKPVVSAGTSINFAASSNFVEVNTHSAITFPVSHSKAVIETESASGPANVQSMPNHSMSLSEPVRKMERNHCSPASANEGHSEIRLSDSNRASATMNLSDILAAVAARSDGAMVNGMHSENMGERNVLPLKSIAEQAVGNSASLGALHAYEMQRNGENGVMSPFISLLNRAGSASSQSQEDQTATIPPSLGASPLGKLGQNHQLTLTLQHLDSTVTRAPLPMDSEKLRYYLQRTPCQTPAYYPQVPPLLADSPDYFNRLSPETLFFIFYYMEGTKGQYMAAKALKKQSWRFHKKYLMWFQRHEEPKLITDEYEQGTYIYFDFEKWTQKKKEGFTFEYRYLEDRELS